MMRKTLFFTLVIFLTACNNPGKFSVSGTIAGADGKTLYFITDRDFSLLCNVNADCLVHSRR